MNSAIRYYSKLGHTKQIADAMVEALEIKALSVTDEPELKEKVDVLFLGGAPYANIMSSELKAYANNLDAEKVGCVVIFSTSSWSKRTINALRKIVEEKGIKVCEDYFYSSTGKVKDNIEAAKEFAKKIVGADK